MPRVYEKADEATKKRLEEMRLKGLETRKMKSALKKADKEQQKEELRKAYEERVLKRQQAKQAEQQAEPPKPQAPPPPPPQQEEETDKDIYNNARYAEEQETETESEEEAPPPPPKARSKKPTSKATPKTYHQPTEPNYKQEYYRLKMMKLQEQDEHNRFLQSYERAPPSVHVADIARQQLSKKIDRELFNSVYNQLFPS